MSRQLSKDIRLFIDPLRLIVPLLLTHAKNKREFFTLFQLSKFKSTRNRILSIIKSNQKISEKLNEIIRKKSTKKILTRSEALLKKFKNNEELNL